MDVQPPLLVEAVLAASPPYQVSALQPTHTLVSQHAGTGILGISPHPLGSPKVKPGLSLLNGLGT